MKFTEIAFYDDGTSGESADYIRRTAEALTTAVQLDFSPEYDRQPVPVRFYADKAQVPPSAAVIPWSSTIDVAGAIAYHTENGGKVTGLVCTTLARQNGQEPSVAAAHEVFELLGDPYCNASTQAANGNIIDREICDPVQDRTYEGQADDGTPVTLSDFVYAAWHDPQSVGEVYSHTGALTAPHSKTDGGYFQYLDPTGQRQQEGMRAEWRAASMRGKKREDLHAVRHQVRESMAFSVARALGEELAALGVTSARVEMAVTDGAAAVACPICGHEAGHGASPCPSQ